MEETLTLTFEGHSNGAVESQLKVRSDGAAGFHTYDFLLMFNNNIKPNEVPL